MKRYLYLKSESQIQKENLIKRKKVLGTSRRSSDYAQALMELGALFANLIIPYVKNVPISKNCKSFIKKDFVLTKLKKIKKINIFYLKFIKKIINIY